MKKILVIGASGFIAQNIFRELIKLNWPICGTVRNLDSLSLLIMNRSKIRYAKVLTSTKIS